MTPREKETYRDSTPPANDAPLHPMMVGMPAGFPGDPDEQPGRLLPGILHALRRRWLLIAFLGSLLGTGAAVGIYYTAKDSFTARALVRIKAEQIDSDFDRYVNSQRTLITGESILNAALNNESLQGIRAINEHEDPLPWYKELISSSFSADSEIMEVRLTFEDSEDSKKLLDAVMTEFLKSAEDSQSAEIEAELKSLRLEIEPENRTSLMRAIDRRNQSQEATATRRTLEDRNNQRRLERANDELFDVEIELTLLKQKIESIQKVDPATGQTSDPAAGETAPAETVAQSIDTDDSDTETTDDQIAEASPQSTDQASQSDSNRTTVDVSGAAPSIEITESELDTFLESDPETQRIERLIERAMARIEDARQRFVPGHPNGEEFIARRQDEIADARIELAERREELRIELNRQLASMQGDQDDSISMAARKAELEGRQFVLQTEINRLRGSLPPENIGKSADVELDELVVADLKGRVERTNAEIRRLEDKLASLPWMVRAGATYAPKTADRKPRLIKAGMAGGAVFLLLGAVIVLFDLNRRRVSSPDDFARDVQLNLIGTLPLLRRSKRKNQRLSRQLAEAVDSIAAALICGRTALDTRVVMITSAVAGEGKTTLAANLATSLASAGRRTLLVDFDLRRPMLHSVYDLERGPGVCETLTGEIESRDACHETDDPSLWVMPAGHWRERAISQLADQRLQQLFDELRSRFDFIVVDASPVLPIVDARLVGKHVDGTILSLLKDVSQVPKVAAACRALESFDVRILGGVMIGSTGEVYYGYPPAQAQLPESA